MQQITRQTAAGSRAGILPYAAFALLVAAVNAAGYFANHLPPSLVASPRASLIRGAVFADCVITIPLAYWLLLVRPGRRTLQSLAFIASLSILRGAYSMQSEFGSAILTAAEAALIAALILGRDSIPGVGLLRAELHVLRFAFRPPRPETIAGQRQFTIHENSDAALLFFVVAAMTPVEAGILHLLLPKTLSWIFAALSAYSMIWLIAIGRSFAALPLAVDAESITLHKGLLAKVRIRRDQIESVTRLSVAEAAPAKAMKFAVLADPAVLIRLREPVTVELPMGFQRRASAFAVAPDDPEAFAAALR